MTDQGTPMWGEAPQGEPAGRQDPERRRGALGWLRSHPKTSVAGGLLALGLFGAGGEDTAPETTKAQTVADVASPSPTAAASPTPDVQAEQAAAAAAALAEEQRVAAAKAAADKAAVAKAAAAKAAADKATAAKAAAAKVAADKAAANRAAAERAAAQQAAEQEANSVSYSNCSEVRAAGAAPIRRGEPGYSSRLDRDGDGIACDT